MRDLRFAFHTKLEFSSGVTDHSFLLRCIPWDDASQRLQSWQLSVRLWLVRAVMAVMPLAINYLLVV